MEWNLVVIFVFVIVLNAMRLHYRSKGPAGVGLASGDQMTLDRAMETARRLELRLETLERVLDEDVPGWRARVRA